MTFDTTALVIVAGLLAGIGLGVLIAMRRRPASTRHHPASAGDPDPAGGPRDLPQPDNPPEPKDLPAPAAGRLTRLRGRLVRGGVLGRGLLGLLSADRLDDAAWQQITDTLVLADVGRAPSEALVGRLRDQAAVAGIADAGAARELLRRELLVSLAARADRGLRLGPVAQPPAVILVVGVNGTGKTTTVGRLARLLTAEGHRVLLGAADTFRAAAVEQLRTWGDRVGVPVVSGEPGADPASVTFAAVSAAREQQADIVLIDTAGRLHTKTSLMDELAKVARVAGRGGTVTEALLVLDATTGQNGLTQAQVFAEAVGLTGVVLTKLDGTAKGGIVIAVQSELGVPVKFIGLGEGPDDLAGFDAEVFVDALLAD